MILLLVILFLCNFKKSKHKVDRYEIYIYAVLQWHMILLSLLYVLSAMKKVNYFCIVSGLFVIDTVIILILWKRWRDNRLNYDILKIWLGDMARVKDKHMIIICIPLIMFLIILFITIKTVPYNYDSMTYHLPRIAHWAQNQSIAPYASNIDRQIGSTRIASYICLYLYILAGKTDVLVNLVQCFAFGTNAIMVYAIARKLGVKQKLSILASMLFLSMPIAIAEASTTQNDNYSSMWLLFFIYLLLDLNDKKNCLSKDMYTRTKVFYIASCVALGYLSKPSVCFAMLIFLFWTLHCVIKRKDSIKVILQLLFIGISTFIAYIAPSIIENIFAFGAFSPSNVGKAQLVGNLKPNYLFLNFLKTFTYNWGNSIVPNTKVWLEETLYFIADKFRVNLNDVSISENALEYGFGSYPYGCDTALQPLLMTLAVLSILWCIFRRKKQDEIQKEYCWCAMLSFILLCIFMRWQSFITRYMIGFFALFCPVIVVQLEDFASVFKRMVYRKIIIIFVAVACIINFTIAGTVNWKIDTKEYPRTYFYHVGSLRNVYENICTIIRDKEYGKIGVVCGVNSYEYPLWGMLQYDEQEYTIKHVLVNGILAKYEDESFNPDCIVMIDRSEEDVFIYNNQKYAIVERASEEQLNVYMYERISNSN